MAQQFFNGLAVLDAANLDANFDDLYGRTSKQSVAGDQTIFSGSSVTAIREGDGGTSFFAINTGNVYYNAMQMITNNGTVVGSISCSLTSVSFNTTSDYRLKNNPQPLTTSGVFIDALNPVTFTWKTTGTADTGFLAHEFQAVSPNSVTGAKDAVNADGSAAYQSMQASTSEVMANVIAELKSLRLRVAALEAK